MKVQATLASKRGWKPFYLVLTRRSQTFSGSRNMLRCYPMKVTLVDMPHYQRIHFDHHERVEFSCVEQFTCDCQVFRDRQGRVARQLSDEAVRIRSPLESIVDCK